MNRAIKYRVYPTTEQCVMFAKTFGCCRKVGIEDFRINVTINNRIGTIRINACGHCVRRAVTYHRSQRSSG